MHPVDIGRAASFRSKNDPFVIRGERGVVVERVGPHQRSLVTAIAVRNEQTGFNGTETGIKQTSGHLSNSYAARQAKEKCRAQHGRILAQQIVREIAIGLTRLFAFVEAEGPNSMSSVAPPKVARSRVIPRGTLLQCE